MPYHLYNVSETAWFPASYTEEQREALRQRWTELNQKQREGIEQELEEWPPHLVGIGRVLLEEEENLSDGYEFYLGDDDEFKRSIIQIAERLYQAAHKGNTDA